MGVLKIYDGSAWQEVSMVADHGGLIGLGDDDHASVYMLLIGSSTDNAIIRWDGAGGRTPQDSTAKITDNGVVTIPAIGDGGLTNYDLKVGDTDGSPTYGMIQFGNAVMGRTSYNVGAIDLDGTIMVRNIGGPVTSEIEFIWTESGGNTCRFALPKSAVGNATYNSRSMLLAGPAPADTDFVKVSYWQGTGIFHNLACDTVGSGADLGVQNDLEVEGDIFTDSIKESTGAAGITLTGKVLAASGTHDFDNDNLTTTGTITGVNVTSGADPGHSHTTGGEWADTVFNVGQHRLDVIGGGTGVLYPYFLEANNNNAIMFSFIFEGTDQQHAATNNEFTIGAAATGGAVDVEIYDITNAAQLATVSVAAGAAALYSDTTFSNIPAGQALMAVRATTAGGGSPETLTILAMSWARAS